MKKVKMKLVGLEGSVLGLMGAFQRTARKQGWSKEEVDVVIQECTSGDYNHLLATLTKHTESK